jgi:hypothetical protein
LSEPLKYEIWRNAIAGTVGIKKTDRRGELGTEVIRAGEKFQISTEDRLLNSDWAATEDLDVFKNGMLTPVKLLDGTEDAQEIASNPNLITESDMAALFSAHWKTFEQKLGQITNVTTLQRLLSMAEAEDTDATVRQVQSIRNRIAEVNPVQVVEHETVVPPRSMSGMTPASP